MAARRLGGPMLTALCLLAALLAGCHEPPEGAPGGSDAMFAECALSWEDVPSEATPGEPFPLVLRLHCPWEWQATEVAGRYAQEEAFEPSRQHYDETCGARGDVSWEQEPITVECTVPGQGTVYLRAVAAVLVAGEPRDLWSAEWAVHVGVSGGGGDV